jgi:hypothetical protein
MILIIIVLFIIGLYLYVRAGKTHSYQCPNLLVQHGNEIWLQNTNMATVPGINPMVFYSLDEYTDYLQNCQVPLLHQLVQLYRG